MPSTSRPIGAPHLRDRGIGSSSAPLEKLYRPLVAFRRRARAKRAEVSALAGPRVLLARVEPVLAAFDLPYHRCIQASSLRLTPSPRAGVRRSFCNELSRICTLSIACMGWALKIL